MFYNSYAQPRKPNIIKSGIYSIQDPSAPPSKTSNHPNPLFPKLTPYQYFLYETPNPNALIKPGKRYLKMLIPTKSLNEHNQLQPEISQLITKIHNII